MGRRYRRSRRSKNKEAAVIVLALILLASLGKWVIYSILIIAALIIAIKLIKKYGNQKNEESSPLANNTPKQSQDSRYTHNSRQTYQSDAQNSYTAKNSIMTDCEIKYFNAIKEIIGVRYSIQPQINLASVIDKESHEKYRSELFRNIDFGIFDESYKLVVLIEINDQSHTRNDRRTRDARVASICEKAGIPLITFWTSYGVNKQYIRSRLSKYLILPYNNSLEIQRDDIKNTTSSESGYTSIESMLCEINDITEEKNNASNKDEIQP